MTTLGKFSIILASILFSPGIQAAELKAPVPKVEYSANQTMEASGTTMSGKIYVTPKKERREMNVSGQNMTMIIRHDKKTGWTLMPAEKMYMEMSFDQAKQQSESLEGYKFETTAMGNETINGVNCEKTKVIMSKSADGRKMDGFWWVSKDGIIMKMDMNTEHQGKRMRIKSELTNLKIGSQDPSLFEIPAGYNKMTMPNMQNIKDMMKSMKQADDASEKDNEKNKGGFNFNDALKLMR